jgi:hypothetical protein
MAEVGGEAHVTVCPIAPAVDGPASLDHERGKRAKAAENDHTLSNTPNKGTITPSPVQVNNNEGVGSVTTIPVSGRRRSSSFGEINRDSRLDVRDLPSPSRPLTVSTPISALNSTQPKFPPLDHSPPRELPPPPHLVEISPILH